MFACVVNCRAAVSGLVRVCVIFFVLVSSLNTVVPGVCYIYTTEGLKVRERGHLGAAAGLRSQGVNR